MSWSVNLVGKPENVLKALETTNGGLTGQSKDEWEAVKPHLSALVAQNFVSDDYRTKYPSTVTQLIRLEASGSVSLIDGDHGYGSCQVKIELIYGNFV